MELNKINFKTLFNETYKIVIADAEWCKENCNMYEDDILELYDVENLEELTNKLLYAIFNYNLLEKSDELIEAICLAYDYIR